MRDMTSAVVARCGPPIDGMRRRLNLFWSIKLCPLSMPMIETNITEHMVAWSARVAPTLMIVSAMRGTKRERGGGRGEVRRTAVDCDGIYRGDREDILRAAHR